MGLNKPVEGALGYMNYSGSQWASVCDGHNWGLSTRNTWKSQERLFGHPVSNEQELQQR